LRILQSQIQALTLIQLTLTEPTIEEH
jgi:hypothetical protein